jgi:hypothetical protein
MHFELDEAMESLERTPGVLKALLAGKSQAWLNCRKTPSAFSPLDVVGHLTHAEETDWIPRVRTILEFQDTKAFDPFDRFGFQHILIGKTIDGLLAEFAEARENSLNILRGFGLEEQQLDLPGLHPELGHVTLRNLLATWVVHDLGHINQIVKTLAGEYGEGVGVWKAYLSILG